MRNNNPLAARAPGEVPDRVEGDGVLLATGSSIDDLVSASPSMREALELARLVAPRDTTVVLSGETGTGKSVLARYIHLRSHRRHLCLFDLNCAALSRDLVEAELFGHEKGAFTGAVADRLGILRAAHCSTLLLDEISEVPLSVQAKLLQALEQGVVRPVGSPYSVRIDVRFIAASNRDLEAEVARRRFRQDLYHRLNVLPIVLPPLRTRTEEIGPLAMRFLRSLCNVDDFHSISPDALEMLCGYSWPGNIRELRNVLERATVLFGGAKELLPCHLTALVDRKVPWHTDRGARVLPIRDLERMRIKAAIQACGGNLTSAARQLGISRATIYRKVKAFGTSAPQPADCVR